MGKDSYEEAVEALKKLVIEKEELKEVAASRVSQITADLKGASSATEPASDPVERLKNGFSFFKKEKYEYVQGRIQKYSSVGAIIYDKFLKIKRLIIKNEIR